jgi:hypothetical protein
MGGMDQRGEHKHTKAEQKLSLITKWARKIFTFVAVSARFNLYTFCRQFFLPFIYSQAKVAKKLIFNSRPNVQCSVALSPLDIKIVCFCLQIHSQLKNLNWFPNPVCPHFNSNISAHLLFIYSTNSME